MADTKPQPPTPLAMDAATEMNADAPPPFRATEENDRAKQQSDVLPEYEPSNAPIRPRRVLFAERVFTLDNSKGKPWAFLKINSRGSSQSAPNFFEGDLITGTVELDLDKAETFSAIILEVFMTIVVKSIGMINI